MTDIEIRRNEDGTLDEVIADVGEFHMEQMDKSFWWIGFVVNGVRYRIDIWSSHPIHAEIERDD